MRALILLSLVLLAGCEGSADGTELGGIARRGGVGPASALQAASDHCARYGRIARPTTQMDVLGYVTFSCEKSY